MPTAGKHTPTAAVRQTRRQFITAAAGVASSVALAHMLGRLAVASQLGDDEEILRDRLAGLAKQGAVQRPIGDVVAMVAQSFLGAPYAAHLLEVPGDERLVVNLRQFDCLLLVENSLAIARCVKLRTSSIGDFKGQLQFIRYRRGIIDGYPSRLHYFSDWMADNAIKGVLEDRTRALGGVRWTSPVTYMSEHRDSYWQLRNTDYLAAIQETEKRLTGTERWYIPKARVRDIQHELRNGDVVGIVSMQAGLDIAHSGLVMIADGSARFFHAPLSGGKVERAEGTLAEYLQRHSQHAGIIVGRPLEPPQ
jgi:hypothetical protein